MASRILIVDEDEKSARELQSALELHNYDVERSTSGETALERLQDTAFDLVIVDIELPKMSGLGLCDRLIHSTPKSLPHFILTSAFLRGAEEIGRLKNDTGAYAFLPKPIETSLIVDRVGEALQKKTSHSGSNTLQGPLNDTVFPKLLRRLSTIGATGLLTVEREKIKKIIYIENGYPIFARSNIVKECLGQMLLQAGRIDQDAFEESLQRQRQSKRLQGTILIEMGLLTPQELNDALSMQITEKVLEIFSWKTGNYTFTPGKKFKAGTTSIQQSPAALILQGVSRFWTKAQTQEFLQPYKHQYLRQVENPRNRFQDIGLDRRGLDLVRECRGEKTLASILSIHPLSETESEKTLTALILSGIIEARHVSAPMDLDEPDLDGQKPSSAKLREKLLEDYSRMMSLDYFSLFNLERDASPQAIRKAYYQIAKHYHPDQLQGQGLSSDIHQKVKELFQHISKAHEVLVDAEARAKYEAKLARGPQKEVDLNQIMQAETAFQKALILLKSNDFKKAAELLHEAVKASPEEPEYLTYLAWAQFKADPQDHKTQEEALKQLNQSQEINAKLDKTYLYKGNIFKQQGLKDKAQRQFELAIQANPNCTEALRELRLYEMRKQKNNRGGGVFSRFLKK